MPVNGDINGSKCMMFYQVLPDCMVYFTIDYDIELLTAAFSVCDVACPCSGVGEIADVTVDG